jgi:alpha-tubulin suppressor-like RCC1 family protein
MTKVIAVGAGEYHSFAVRADGSLWGWGLNTNHQLADGTTTSRKWAQPVQALLGIVSATGGQEFSQAVSAEGELWA